MNQQPSQLEHHTQSESDTVSFAAALARTLRPGDVITLTGDLGAGKTCFVRGLAIGLGISPAEVSSPTFVLRHDYAGRGCNLTHIDAYRLSSHEDLESLGWEELLQQARSIIALEWPERVRDALPPGRIEVSIHPTAASDRLLNITLPPSHPWAKSDQSPTTSSFTGSRTPARCPSCGKQPSAESRFLPFCSERCRLADLHSWLSGGHVISTPIQPDDEIQD